MAKKASTTPGKNQMTFDAFLFPKPAAQPMTPSTQVKPKLLSENQVTDLTKDVAPASHIDTKAEGIAMKERFATGGGNAVVVPNFSSGTLFPTKNQLRKRKQIEGPIPRTDGNDVDLSKYHAQETGPRIKKDGFVYFCRAGKHHFIGPIIINTSIKNNDPFYNVFTCPICGSAAINNILSKNNAIPDPAGIGKDFCETCGCMLETDIRGSDTKICYNCNKDLETLKLRKENQNKHGVII